MSPRNCLVHGAKCCSFLKDKNKQTPKGRGNASRFFHGIIAQELNYSGCKWSAVCSCSVKLAAALASFVLENESSVEFLFTQEPGGLCLDMCLGLCVELES